MKRRSFFGFAAGAAVAGPSMAKEAIGKVAELAQINVGAVGGLNQAPRGAAGLVGQAAKQTFVDGDYDPKAWAVKDLAKLMGLAPNLRSRLKRRMYVDRFDPDISTYRSIALHAKIDWQRERDLDRRLGERRGYLQRVVSGVMGEDDELDGIL